MFARGVFFIAIGLFKKAVISDYISLNFVDRIFDNPSLYSGLENLLGIYGYAMQIYCDFSGYSDMAIGIALLLGFHFPMNFRSPYASESITDFWRRWHISLSSWIRDYIYISLGGNRKGRVRTYVNLIVTMLLGGLWHGASLNFVFWGGLHGVALAVHKILRKHVFGHGRSYSSEGVRQDYSSTGWRRIGATILTFHFVCLAWVFFRNTTFTGSWTMLSRIITDFHAELLPQVLAGYPWVFGIMLFGYVTHYLPESLDRLCIVLLRKGTVVASAIVLSAVIFLVIQTKSSTIQPFIYFQF